MTTICCNFINSSKSLSSFMSAEEAELLIGKVISDIEKHSKSKLNIHRDEMLKMGVIGLVKAATEYDASKSCKFSTFAYPCIRNTIINEGKKLRKKETPVASLKGKYSENDGDWIYYFDTIASDSATDREMFLEDLHNDLYRVLHAVIRNKRNADIVFQRVGEDISCKELAVKYGVCAETIRQTVKSCLERLQESYEAKQLLCKYAA
ncbi:MAG: sigma-70 family RNA polymerase sigma factor [Bacteroidaceae bacterium]|nr:sigma-70 family RNA polymerase sigma factor [Bacteroidaceae bacterium]